MNFVRFKAGNNKVKSGVIFNGKLYSFKSIFGCNIQLNSFVENFKEEDIAYIRSRAKKHSPIDLDQVTFLSPFEEPRRNIICLGKNYLEHVNECDTGGIDQNLGRPAKAIYFSKMVNEFVNPNEEIALHEGVTNMLDYEGELAVIIGKKGSNIPLEKVEDYVFGYTIINDISARDIQKGHTQWLRGKSLDDTTSFGPTILYKDQISFPPKLKIETRVNGQLRQSNFTNNLIFDIASCISEFSKGTTLKKGDIIATGTPAGVGMGLNPPLFLKKNDKIEIEIEKIGKLINVVK